MPVFAPILTTHWRTPECHTLDCWRRHEGYEGARQALAMEPKALIELVKASGLRGRGGAGFPTGVKWGFVPIKEGQQRYLSINADESEPGTFKDRYLLKLSPHQLIEGIIITAWAVQAHTAFVYVRGEFPFQYRRFTQALAEAQAAGLVGPRTLGADFPLKILPLRGAGAYICGEETAQLTSIEGHRGNPRLKPPFPAVVGLFGCPTVINNVETVSNLPHIVRHGAAWYRQWGTEKAPGARLFSVSGHVARPGVYELPMDVPWAELLARAGGVWKGRALKAMIPGGSSAPVLTAAETEGLCMDPESIAAKGSMAGSSGVIVLDETTDIVSACLNLMKFYHHESCGQCTPCREGTGWLEKIVARIHQGGARAEDEALLHRLCDQMCGTTICVLSDAAAMPMRAFLQKFPAEFRARIGSRFVVHGSRPEAEAAHAPHG